MLEPYDGKLSRTVLRRESGGNTADPADHLLVRFFQPVEALVDGKGGVFVDEQFVQV